MQGYRLCFRDAHDRIWATIRLDSENDQDAIDEASGFRRKHPLELWHFDRVVRRIDPLIPAIARSRGRRRYILQPQREVRA